jgi:hypothetical protein
MLKNGDTRAYCCETIMTFVMKLGILLTFHTRIDAAIVFDSFYK